MKRFAVVFSDLYRLLNELGEGAAVEELRCATWQPPVDIFEREDRIVVVVELPGVDKNQINVNVIQNVLKITGARPKRLPESTVYVHQIEIPHGPFARLIKIPTDAAVESIEAEYQDGYLTVIIRKAR